MSILDEVNAYKQSVNKDRQKQAIAEVTKQPVSYVADNNSQVNKSQKQQTSQQAKQGQDKSAAKANGPQGSVDWGAFKPTSFSGSEKGAGAGVSPVGSLSIRKKPVVSAESKNAKADAEWAMREAAGKRLADYGSLRASKDYKEKDVKEAVKAEPWNAPNEGDAKMAEMPITFDGAGGKKPTGKDVLASEAGQKGLAELTARADNAREEYEDEEYKKQAAKLDRWNKIDKILTALGTGIGAIGSVTSTSLGGLPMDVGSYENKRAALDTAAQERLDALNENAENRKLAYQKLLLDGAKADRENELGAAKLQYNYDALGAEMADNEAERQNRWNINFLNSGSREKVATIRTNGKSSSNGKTVTFRNAYDKSMSYTMPKDVWERNWQQVAEAIPTEDVQYKIRMNPQAYKSWVEGHFYNYKDAVEVMRGLCGESVKKEDSSNLESYAI